MRGQFLRASSECSMNCSRISLCEGTAPWMLQAECCLPTIVAALIGKKKYMGMLWSCSYNLSISLGTSVNSFFKQYSNFFTQFSWQSQVFASVWELGRQFGMLWVSLGLPWPPPFPWHRSSILKQ